MFGDVVSLAGEKRFRLPQKMVVANSAELATTIFCVAPKVPLAASNEIGLSTHGRFERNWFS
jgi:hypothetical protein